MMDDPAPPNLPYSAHVVFPNDHDLRSAVFSPDGSALYAHVVVPTINIWRLAVSFWPEALAVLLGLVTLFALWRWRSIATRPRQREKLYCRHCNYDVTPQVAPTDALAPPARNCPECGKALSSRTTVHGRSTLRRLCPLVALWLIASLAYASLHIFSVPREGAVSHWFSWCRADLAGWATDQRITWLTSRVRKCDRIFELDSASGAIRQIITTRPRETRTRLAISPDGRFLFLGANEFLAPNGRSSLECINIASGGVHRVAQFPGMPPVYRGGATIIGFSPDGSAAYVQWHNHDAAIYGVSAWHLSTNVVSDVLNLPAHEFTYAGTPGSLTRNFILRFDNNGTPTFLSYPGQDTLTIDHYVVRLYEAGAEVREIELTPPPDFYGEPAWRHSDHLITLGKSSTILSTWSLSHAALLADTPVDITKRGPGNIAHDADVRFLVWGFSNFLHVRDVVADRWVANLECPPNLAGAEPLVSRDARWCAAVFLNFGNPPGVHVFELVTWKLNADQLLQRQPDAGTRRE